MKKLNYQRSINHFLGEDSEAYARLKTGEFELITETTNETAIGLGLSEKSGGVGVYQRKDYKGVDFFERIKTMREMKKIDAKDFEIMYSFSNAMRGDTGYGAKNWSARYLYEFLCTKFNGGNYFIDDYLQSGDFYMSPAYLELWSALDEIDINIENEYIGMMEADNEGKRPVDLWNKQYNFQKRQVKTVKDKLNTFEREIKQDLINQMRSRLPEINWELSDATNAIRERLGIPTDVPGYATGWLINQVTFVVILAGGEQSGMVNFFYSSTYGQDRGWQA